jgi:recombinational DNA repair protein (RecF pathway)
MYMADLVHHMLIDHDPHPRVFDALSSALARIDEQASHADVALLNLQWATLSEAGYTPELQRDARSGAHLPDSPAAALAFSAAAGGIVDGGAAEPPGDRWKVRRETIDLLRDLAAGGDIAKRDGADVRRANRLLAAYAREIIGSEPPAMRWAFPDLTAPRPS